MNYKFPSKNKIKKSKVEGGKVCINLFGLFRTL